MKITFLGHAALLIETESHRLVVDPFITGNELARDKISLQDLQPDVILLTHAHQDHVLDVEALARDSRAQIISNYEIVSYYQNKGFEGHPMNHGGAREFEFPLVISEIIDRKAEHRRVSGGQKIFYALKQLR